MKLCVLTSSEEYVWAYNNITPKRAIDDSGTKDPAGVELLPDDYKTASKTQSTFELKEYEYLNLLEQTATPINYFIAMQLITQNSEFMNAFVEKCNQENSYIELGFLESTESTFEHYNYGTDSKDEVRGATISTFLVDVWNQYKCCNDTEEVVGYYNEQNPITRTKHNSHDNGEGEIINQIKGNYIGNEEEVAATLEKYVGYKVKDFLNVKIQNTGDLYLIEANTWNIDYKLEPHVGQIERPFSRIQTVKKVQFPEDPVKFIERLDEYPKRRIGEHCTNANHYSNLYEWKNTHFYIYESYAKWTNKYHVYSVVNGTYKTDVIMELLTNYPEAEKNISSASYLLFALLEQNGNTQELERYMRYVLSDISGHQYLTDNTKNLEFNFSIGLSDDNLYNYNYDGSTTNYRVDSDSSASSTKVSQLSGGSGKTAWHLEKKTKISTTDQDGELISTREYYYFKQGTGTNICGRTSLATCLSGLGIRKSDGTPYTPTEISPQNTNNWFSWATTLGVKATRYTNNLRGKLIEHLSTGNPAIVHIKVNSDPNNVYNTKGGHFIAVVGVKYAGDVLVYVLDPGSSRPTRTENYISINTVLAYADEIRTFSR